MITFNFKPDNGSDPNICIDVTDRARNAPDGGNSLHKFQPNGPGVVGSDLCTICEKTYEEHPSGVGVDTELALKEATALAVSLFNQHYRDDEDYASGRVPWKPLPDLRGVISQIDNMTAGLSRASPTDSAQDVVKALDRMMKEHDILSGNFGDVMDPKHLCPDRWPQAASMARNALAAYKRSTTDAG